MKIYGSPLSPFVARVILACDHKSLAHDVIMPEGGLKTPDYLALNPFGKIPAIQDGRQTLYESDVIVHYLDDKYPTKALLPKSPGAAGKALLIAKISDLYVQAPALLLFRQVVGRSTKNKAEADQALADMDHGLTVLNGYIKPGPCALGKSFSVGDCFALPALFFAAEVGPLFGVKDPFKGKGNIKKYWAAIKKHRSAQSQFAEMQKLMKARLKSL